MSPLSSLWRNIKEMPQLLRMFCQGGMVAAPILAVLLVLPLTDWRVNGKQLPYRELWSSGAGLVMLVFVLTAAAGAWGLAAKTSWSRWAWVAAPVAPLIVAAVYRRTWFTEELTRDPYIWLGSFATSAIIFVCLFSVPAVRNYVKSRADA